MVFLVYFLTGGFLYCMVELVWSGRTHPSMFAAGGLCFFLINNIDSAFSAFIGTVGVCILCGAAITSVEYTAGCLLNRRLRLSVWDYSSFRANAAGQVCLRYSVYWCLLSYPAALLAKAIRIQLG